MKIPKGDLESAQFFYELVEKCCCSMERRRAMYGNLRNQYLFGCSPEEAKAPYNKIQPSIDTLTSFLFSADTTKFKIDLDAEIDPKETKKIKPLAKAIHNAWHTSNADMIFGEGVTWALVYGTMFVKLIMRNGEVHPFLVEPHCMGVLREDVPWTDRQEAFVHCYYTTKTQLEIDLESHPKKQSILDVLHGEKKNLANNSDAGLDRILIANQYPLSGTMQGNVNLNLAGFIDYIPKVDDELIEMQELYVFDDELNDYRIITRADNKVTVYDRKNFFLDGEHNFIQICPRPMYSYYWGLSEVDFLTGLQNWRNERIYQMRKLLALQVDPPKAMTGMGIIDEKLAALNNPGGFWFSGDPMTKPQVLAPEIPDDLFKEINMIDEMFAEETGLQNVLMGRGETGVRSGKQTSELARLGSSRIKKRALTVEKSLGKIATIYLKCLQTYDDRAYTDDDGDKFIANQFTKAYSVNVDGHSNSPLFAEDHKSLATELLEAKAITREEFIDMLDPPGKEAMLLTLKTEIEPKEAAAAKAAQEAEAQKHAAHAPHKK